MTRNIILILSSKTGIGAKIAETIQSNISGVTNILNVNDVIKNNQIPLLDLMHHKANTDIKLYFIVPEFNGSYPAPFKQLIDNLGWPNVFKSKDIMLIGYSGGFSGNILGINHLSTVLNYIGANIHKNYLYFTNTNIEINSEQLTFLKTELKKFKNYE